jgi:hypothetical protein
MLSFEKFKKRKKETEKEMQGLALSVISETLQRFFIAIPEIQEMRWKQGLDTYNDGEGPTFCYPEFETISSIVNGSEKEEDLSFYCSGRREEIEEMVEVYKRVTSDIMSERQTYKAFHEACEVLGDAEIKVKRVGADEVSAEWEYEGFMR